MPEAFSPTDEQAAVLDASGRLVRVNARAGTGKTTTLRLLAERFRDRRVLYVVFNRRARREAERAFPAGVEVRTVHSLAHGSVRRGYAWQVGEGGGHSIVDLLPHFEDLGEEAQLLAALAAQFLIYFLNSPHPQIEAALEPFADGHLSQEQRRDFGTHAERVVAACRALTTDWHHGRRPCPHDFYLKLSHRDGALARQLNRFDVVLVDEAQDLSPVMLDALEVCQRRVFLVGDSHQQIYGFRYAVDAMKRLPCDETLELSQSFRFGKGIAKVVRAFVRAAKDEPGFSLRGRPKRRSTARVSDAPAHRGQRAGSAVLARTNLGLFNTAVELHRREVPFVFERDIQPLLYQALDVYNLANDDPERVRDPFVRSFASLEHFKRYAEAMEDAPRLQLATLIERHQERMPGLIFDLLDDAKRGGGRAPADSVVLATVHAAKGEQYERVTVHEDVAHAFNRALEEEPERLKEEANVAYVAMTRAVSRLQLPAKITESLKLDWDRLTGAPASKPRQRRHASRAPDFRMGDRVRTAHGAGTVVYVSGGRVLVDLDAQPSKVWTERHGLRPLEP